MINNEFKKFIKTLKLLLCSVDENGLVKGIDFCIREDELFIRYPNVYLKYYSIQNKASSRFFIKKELQKVKSYKGIYSKFLKEDRRVCRCMIFNYTEFQKETGVKF